MVVGKAVRLFFALQGLAGVLRVITGLVQRDGAALVTGVGQFALAALVLSLHGGRSETIEEVRGPHGDFVIRTAKRQAWRSQRGWRRALLLAWGGCLWRTSVRRRVDDPFGKALWYEDAQTEENAMEVSKRAAAVIRAGSEWPGA